MAITIKVPTLPESVTDGTIATWYKQVGDYVQEGEVLVDLETDKIMMEVPAPVAGVLVRIDHQTGASVQGEVVLAEIDETQAAPEKEAVVSNDAVAEPTVEKTAAKHQEVPVSSSTAPVSPSVRRQMHEQGVQAQAVQGSGPKGRIMAHDLQTAGSRRETRVPMSRLRARLAERLLNVQQSAAILTTFNEVNMQPVMSLRSAYKDIFETTHDTRLGFMSFFLKASVAALKKFPVINASMDQNDVIYHEYIDIGIAVASKRGLVVPVLRHVENMSMAEIESTIRDYAKKAQGGKLTMDDLTGGTFTVTNGGTFGSMLSTPIINPPQSAILGMHNIVKRPVVEGDSIVIRPMMYLALSYDHRLIDGAEAVQFLVTIKQMLEDPARMLLDV